MTTPALPSHVLRPGRTTDYDAADDYTKRAGLGYAILRALGAHERLSPVALATIAKWSAEYGAMHGGVTPDPMALRGQDFEQRVGRAWGADKAASNAARYPGGRGGRPGYAQVFQDVWVDRRWPKLRDALGLEAMTVDLRRSSVAPRRDGLADLSPSTETTVLDMRHIRDALGSRRWTADWGTDR